MMKINNVNKTNNRQIEIFLNLLKQAQLGSEDSRQPGPSHAGLAPMVPGAPLMPMIPPIPFPAPSIPFQPPRFQPDLPKQTLPQISPESPSQTFPQTPFGKPDIAQHLQDSSKGPSSSSNFDLSTLIQYLKDPRVIIPILTFILTMGIERSTREDSKTSLFMPIIFTLLSVLGTQAYHAMTHPEDKLNDLLKKYLGIDLANSFSDAGKEIPKEIPKPVPNIAERPQNVSDNDTMLSRYGIGPLTMLGTLGGLALPNVSAYREARNKAITQAVDDIIGRINRSAPSLEKVMAASGIRKAMEERAFGNSPMLSSSQRDYQDILSSNLENIFTAFNPNAPNIPPLPDIAALEAHLQPGQRLELSNLRRILGQANDELKYLYKKNMPLTTFPGFKALIGYPALGGFLGYVLDAVVRNMFPYS